MRTLIILAGLLSSGVASAELRFINATGQALTVDVLHADGQERDIKLAASRGITQPYGPDISDDSHMVVVRDSSGKELLRESMKGNRIHVIKYWGTSTSMAAGEVGMYRGTEFDMTKIGLINATGQELRYKTELPDFSVSEADSHPNGVKDVHYTSLFNLAKERDVTFKIQIKGETIPISTHEMVTGGLYHITRSKAGFGIKKVDNGEKAKPDEKANADEKAKADEKAETNAK